MNVAILGCGGVAGLHADVLADMRDICVTAVCDIKPARAEAMAGRFGAKAYTDYHQMLRHGGLNAVHICTPHYLHAQMAIDAIKAGLFVLCEKPMAITAVQCRQMIEADRAAGGNRLCIVFQNRYNSSSRELKAIVQDGRYGALKALRGLVCWHRGASYYSDDWHGTLAKEGGGVMINQAIHTLDLLQWLGGGVKSVAGQIGTNSLKGVIEVEDTASAFLRMKSGITAMFFATVAYAVDSPVEVEAVFEEATVLLKSDKLYRWQEDGLMPLVAPKAQSTGHRDYWGAGHGVQIEDFYRSIKAGEPFFIDGAQGMEAVKILTALYQSSAAGQEIFIDGGA